MRHRPATRRLALLASVAIMAAPLAVHAQPASEPAPGPAAGAPMPVPPPAPADDPPELGAAYDAAFAALTGGDLDSAIAGFDSVALRSVREDRRGAARELARLARELKARRVRLVVDSGAAGAPGTPLVRRVPEDDRPGAGRIEVVAVSTIASFYSGFVLLDLLDVSDFRTGALLVTGTTAAGFAVSLFGTRDRDITSGMSASYSLGLGLGVANGLLLASPLGVESSDKGFLSMGLGGMVLGGIGGMVLGDHVRPTVAQASLAGTTAIMGIATVGLGLGLTQPDLDADTLLVLLAGGLDVGTAAGLGVAKNLDWSKGRARLVSLGAFLGALGGFGISAIALGAPDTDSEGRVFSGAVLAGMWGGFALTTHLTHDMAADPRFAEPDENATAQVMPTLVGGSPGFAVAGSF